MNMRSLLKRLCDMLPSRRKASPRAVSMETSASEPLESQVSVPPAAPQIASIEMLQRTYTGLLDDVMIRYSDDYIGEDFFNKMIAKNIFFGGGLYLNDGYLVNHPISRKHLYDDGSLLRVMLATNFVRILTRTANAEELAAMPETMAKSGNASFQELIGSSEWDDFSGLLRRISFATFFNNNQRSWPNYDMSVGYKKLTEGIFQHPPGKLGLRMVTADQLKRIRDAYFKSEPERGNPRHKYEVACREVVTQTASDVPGSMRELMDIGNQAYHYNFGLTLTAEEDNGIAVDTTIGAAFDELLRTRTVERGQIDNIPLIQVPQNIPLEHGDLFRPFTDPASRVAEAKLAYLTALNRLLSEDATRVSELRADVSEATNLYLDRIKEVFAKDYGRIAMEIEFGASITFATGQLTQPALSRNSINPIATAAPMAGLAIQLQAAAMAKSREFLVERFRIKDVTEEFNSPTPQIITLGDIRPQLTSLAFNERSAQDFIKDVPKIRKV